MSNRIRNFIEKHFNHYYELEVAKYFAIKATFVESSIELYPDDPVSLNTIIDELYKSAYDKLHEFFPTIRKVSSDRVADMCYAIAVRSFATHHENHIVYGLTVWVKNGKNNWKTYDSAKHSWESVDLIPYDGFYVFYHSSDSLEKTFCGEFEKIQDFYFVY